MISSGSVIECAMCGALELKLLVDDEGLCVRCRREIGIAIACEFRTRLRELESRPQITLTSSSPPE